MTSKQNMRLPVDFETSSCRVIIGDGPNDWYISYRGSASVFGNLLARSFDKRSKAAVIRELKEQIREMVHPETAVDGFHY